MKNTVLWLSLLAFAACNHVGEEKTSAVDQSLTISNEDSVANGSSLKADTIPDTELSYYEKNFRNIDSKEYIGSKTLEQHIADPLIPYIFKDIFLQKIELNDDEMSLSLFDSLFSKDQIRHPFYFRLVTRTAWWSDGAFSEMLYVSMKKYVEENPKQFISYFQSEPTLTMADYDNWAEGVAMEIKLSNEDNEKEEILKTENMMLANCSGCSEAETKLIKHFTEKIKKYYP